jgi:hypothetical protein
MKDYPIVKKIREVIADLELFGEPNLYDIAIATLGALPDWPTSNIGEELDIENFKFYEINENDILIKVGGDWQDNEMLRIVLTDGILTYKKVVGDFSINTLHTIDEIEEAFTPTREDERDKESEPIKINRFEYEPVKLYNPQERIIGLILNEVELHDIRIQIKEKKLKGYFLYWKGMKIRIDHEGGIEHWPNGFFDQISDRLMILLGI